MKSDLLLAVTQLAAERSLPAHVVVSAVQDALTMAYERDRVSSGQEVVVKLDPDTGDVTVQTVRNVVEQVENPQSEWTVEEAQKVMPNAQIGDKIITGVIEQNPGRIAAQTAKQLVMQRLRDAERQLVYDEFAAKQGEVITATIQRADSRFVTLDLGRAEAVMPASEQVPTERYRVGMRLKVYIVEVRKTARGPEIIGSRTHSQLLRRVFETEVPEIFNGIVEIRAIAREPGTRSKVAVFSGQSGVDPVGACIGLRGIRIQSVVNELMGEKIDVIEWNEDPAVFIAKALSPAQIDQVRLNDETNSATVIVSDRSLSLAIGREGQNARLAAKLTNWHIDIKSASDAAAEQAQATADHSVAVAEPTSPDAAQVSPVISIRQEGSVVEAPAAESAPLEVREPIAAESSEPAPAAAAESTATTEVNATQPQQISAEEELALLALEEELHALEEQERAKQEEESQSQPSISPDSEDIWQVGDFTGGDSGSGRLRFAEDIVDEYRESSPARRGGRGRRGGSQTISHKARRSAARKSKQGTNK